MTHINIIPTIDESEDAPLIGNYTTSFVYDVNENIDYIQKVAVDGSGKTWRKTFTYDANQNVTNITAWILQ